MSDQLESAQVTEWQMRLLTMDYARIFAASVERTADEIAAQTEDPRVRRAALLWKTNAIAASQSALPKDDPVVVVIDMWALTEQMARFLESDAGRELFGDWQPMASEAARNLERKITELAGSLSAQQGAPRMRETVEAWVAEHPIDLNFTRQHPRSVIESLPGGSRLGALAAVESLEETVAIHTQLLPVFLEILPKQASWRAELVIDDYFSRQEIEKAAEDLDGISTSLRSIHEEIDELPALLDDQREALFVEVRKEALELTAFIDQHRIATLEGIDSQRLKTLDALAEERQIVLVALAAERQIVLDAVAEERQIVLDAVDRQRLATLAELPALVGDSMQRAEPDLRSLVDYIFWRAALLGGSMGALGLLLATLLSRQFRAARTAPRSTE